jgi:hypothetical protein
VYTNIHLTNRKWPQIYINVKIYKKNSHVKANFFFWEHSHFLLNGWLYFFGVTCLSLSNQQLQSHIEFALLTFYTSIFSSLNLIDKCSTRWHLCAPVPSSMIQKIQIHCIQIYFQKSLCDLLNDALSPDCVLALGSFLPYFYLPISFVWLSKLT